MISRCGLKVIPHCQTCTCSKILQCNTWPEPGKRFGIIHRTVQKRRLFFAIQDDSVVIPDVDVDVILSNLICDPDVDYVKFLFYKDCFEGMKHYNNSGFWGPCTPHRSGKLQRMHHYSDRPHLATRKFYDEVIFPQIKNSFIGTPEQAVCSPCIGKTHGTWYYGVRGDMFRDSNLLKTSIGHEHTGHEVD